MDFFTLPEAVLAGCKTGSCKCRKSNPHNEIPTRKNPEQKILVPAPQGMEAPQAIEPPRGTGEGVGIAVEIPTSTPIHGATTRYFPVRRVCIRYLVVCYNIFIGRGRAF